MSLLLAKKKILMRQSVSPSIRYTAVGEANTGTSVVLTFAAPPIAGDVIVIHYSGQGALTTVPAGFVADFTQAAFIPLCVLYTKVADGSEGNTFTFSNATNGKKGLIGYIIKDWNSEGLRQVQTSTTSSNVSVGTLDLPPAGATVTLQPRTIVLCFDGTEVLKFPTWLHTQGNSALLAIGTQLESSPPSCFSSAQNWNIIDVNAVQFRCQLNSGDRHQAVMYTLRN